MAPAIKPINVLYIAMFPVIWNRETRSSSYRKSCCCCDQKMEKQTIAIDCYDCNSFNKSDPKCGDPFHPAYGELKRDCQQGKDGFVGLYPAKYCIKLIGTTVDDDVEMVYRGCSLDTLDNQCGDFKFEGVRYRGCMMSCTENACNDSVSQRAEQLTLIFVMSLPLLILVMST